MIAWLDSLPAVLVYAFLGLGAALENIVPPVPADTFVVLGGFLAAQGRAQVWVVFLATWGANVASALAVYGVGARYGPAFFRGGLGRYLLKPRQMDRLRTFYDRWGMWAIFATRFLPGFRAIVPVFAGVTHQPPRRVVLPLTTASALWYGFLTWIGAFAGRNIDALLAWVGGLNRTLVLVALALAVVVGVWWYRSHRDARDPVSSIVGPDE